MFKLLDLIKCFNYELGNKCNNIEDFKEFPKNINYRYYISEANKIIYALKTIQTSLFDNEIFN